MKRIYIQNLPRHPFSDNIFLKSETEETNMQNKSNKKQQQRKRQKEEHKKGRRGIYKTPKNLNKKKQLK